MKKFYGILMLAMLAVCSIAFVSCGDEDEDKGGSSSSIVGTWQFQNGRTCDILMLISNGTFEWYDIVDYGDEIVESEHCTGRYKVSGEMFTLIEDGDQESEEFRFKIEGNTMTVWEYYEDEDKWEVMGVYVKKE